MQRYKIKITDLATKDFESICDSIAYLKKDKSNAIKKINGLHRQISALQGFPERNELDEDSVLAAKGVRVEHYEDYNIYYVVANEANIVYVLRIIQVLSGEAQPLCVALGVRRVRTEIVKVC